jgi:hypothetical protein
MQYQMTPPSLRLDGLKLRQARDVTAGRNARLGIRAFCDGDHIVPGRRQIQFPNGSKAGVPADQGEIMAVGSQVMLTGALISGVMYAYVWVCMAHAVNCY